MTPDPNRELAAEMIRAAVAGMDMGYIEDYLDHRHLPIDPLVTLVRVAEAVRTANVEITWPDPCPACGVVGCTEHPTWAAASAVAVDGLIRAERRRAEAVDREAELTAELPEWERELLARQAAESTPAAVPEPAPNRLTQAQEFRIHGMNYAVTMRERWIRHTLNEEADFTGAVIGEAQRYAHFVEHGPDLPKPAGYSETLTVSGTDEPWAVDVASKISLAAHDALVPPARAGYSQTLVTAQDPGGLLSEPEMGTASAADLDMIAKTTGGGIRSSEITPEYDEEGDDA